MKTDQATEADSGPDRRADDGGDDAVVSNGRTDPVTGIDPGSPSARVDLHDPRQRAAVEQVLASVPGVLSVRLVPGFDRLVDELHVLSTLDKAPKQAVRDLQSVLMARFAVPIDHRVISVVQLDERDQMGEAARLAISEVGLKQSGMTVVAEVCLRDGEEELRGTSEASSTAPGRYRATALATLAAVRERLGDQAHVELEVAGITDAQGRRVAVTVLALRTGRHIQELSGCALVHDGEPDAVARSVLDALNRTLADVLDG